MTAYIFDTETTGKDDGAQLVEAAYIKFDTNLGADGEFLGYSPVDPCFSMRYKASVPIQFGAMATHHITDEDLVDCPSNSEFQLPPDTEYIIGHNIDYDWKVIGSPVHIKRIDTLALANAFWRDSDAHTQSACMYRIDRELARSLTKNAHGALADVQMCAIVLSHICREWKIRSVDELYQLSEKARIPQTIWFGKHAGANIQDIPGDYKRWYLGQANTDPYLVKAMRGEVGISDDMAHELSARKNADQFALTAPA